MELESKKIKDDSALNRILIFNKIKHKPLFLFRIFPYTIKRPFILTYLIENDFALKNSLKKTINRIKTKNFQKESIDDIYKFVIYKLMKEIDILSLGKYMFDYILYQDCYSFIDNYEKDIIRYFKQKKQIPQDLNIPYKLIEKYIPSGKELKNFVEDYLFFNINLFYLPLNIDSKINKDSLYLYDLKEESKIHQLINLFCVINKYKYYRNIKTIYYKYINRIYFVFDNEHNCENLLNIIYQYLEKIIHKENIKSIIFDKSFSEENLVETSDKYELTYTKIYLEYLVDNYFDIIKKDSKIDFHLSSLEEIDFSDDNIINDIQCFKLRYNLSKIFSNKMIFKVIMITPKDYNNISNLSEEEKKKLMKKMNQFEKENTKCKILYLNFCNNSPYQANFAYFCEKYLNLNNNINIILIDNIGENNKENDFFKNNTNFKKIKLPYLKSIIYEKDITSYKYKNINDGNNGFSNELNNQIYNLSFISAYDNIKILENEDMVFDRFDIKKFVDDFFDYSGLSVYEGYDYNNILIYLNIIEKIPNNELYRIFFIENKICKLKLNNEKKFIKFDKSNNKLTLKKHNSEKEKEEQIKCHINTFDEFLNKLNQKKLKNKNIIKNGNINKIISISQIITTESQLNFLINGLSKVIEEKNLEFNLIYKAKSDKSKINQIINVIGNNRYILLLVKTNKGSIFGAYTYLYDYNKYMDTNKKELGIVFNFIDEKIYYNVEGFIYKENKGIEIKDYFYILKPSFRIKNKIMYDLIEIGERYFTCKNIEFYEIY